MRGVKGRGQGAEGKWLAAWHGLVGDSLSRAATLASFEVFRPVNDSQFCLALLT